VTGLPILTAGGSVYGARTAEAELMANTLRDEFHTQVRWTEGQSHTTWENAQYTAAMLRREGITHVLLVTHALHMTRSVYSFERAGLEVTAAPLGFHQRGDYPLLLMLLPSANAIDDTAMVLHEILGRVWYWLRS
jgi:uncharacterized SAM-binding protein YcdF (DUF218 family)